VAALKLRIVPNAKRDEVVGEYGDAVKIKVAAPAVEGKANAALLEFVAERLGVPTRALSLVAGEKSRDKLIAVAGMEPEEARRKLLGAV
jgi:hypothetical protein